MLLNVRRGVYAWLSVQKRRRMQLVAEYGLKVNESVRHSQLLAARLMTWNDTDFTPRLMSRPEAQITLQVQ